MEQASKRVHWPPWPCPAVGGIASCWWSWRTLILRIFHDKLKFLAFVSKVNLIVVQSLSRVRFFVTPRTAERPASPSFTISCSLFKLGSIELVMSSNHLVLCG